uniref:MORN repeat-containing protein 5 n=1 Tax=Chromera velia CCMP2878 TaxID=1169474 RepID=A0A0G4F473_9ALVE|mmetsp:Transcript_11942/g.22922  ORF Transcript_11942/g.22922 Transcript_11942/m.22922 type:complete len:319 (-) Transcript_11942:1072-2028(-)|eukprot:Cvel_14937.t1-p1 / transcript=Cvel_14937.t1 / gene=Cvel_14937 / organism=Chromera_velia_CCMP2878 / gene_product=Phosphatidylinositol 4-phosphate 5-kinase 2, putative / transcript_product=Phosphatidylinositol 4-phosphate 5-kinase 2, putative / location=Cvel_scaffold1083:46521-52187(+) / protein_length=318 / sequence_SO=supercontig / SO=protein_coding / is_pseudo=false
MGGANGKCCEGSCLDRSRPKESIAVEAASGGGYEPQPIVNSNTRDFDKMPTMMSGPISRQEVPAAGGISERGGTGADAADGEGWARDDGCRCVGDPMGSQGVIKFGDGSEYSGQWNRGYAEGEGTLMRSDGSKYEGQFERDVPHGNGTEVYPDGSVYRGEFIDGAKEGHGVFEWTNGTRYEGQFQKNAFHGYGRYDWNDGRKFRGQWADNKFQGYGRMTWVDGRKYEGFYVNDRKSGLGTFEWGDGRKHTGNWLEGKQHGKGIFTTSNGFARAGVWERGQRTEWTSKAVAEADIDEIKEPEIFPSPPPEMPKDFFAPE